MTLPKKNIIRIVLALLFVFTVATICLANEETKQSTNQAKEMVYHLKNMHTHPWFWEVLASSAVGWLLGLVRGFSGVKDWIATYWPTAPKLAVAILDLFIFIVVGAYLGTGIYNPTSFLAAIGAGITWPIGLGSLTTKASKPGGGGTPEV
jgi:hypothetical protein